MSYHIYEHLENDTIRREWLPNGKTGNLYAMLEMRAVVRAALGLDNKVFDNRLYELASRILAEANVQTHDRAAQLKVIHEWVVTNIRYVNDPPGGDQTLEQPEYTLQRGYAACSGLTMLEATLLGNVGFLVGFEAARYDQDVVGYSHVYCYVSIDGSLIYLDPTAFDKPAGWRQTGALDTARVLVNDDSQAGHLEMNGFFDFLETIGGSIANIFVPGSGNILIGDAQKREQTKAQNLQIRAALDAEARGLTQGLFTQLSAKLHSNGGQGLTPEDLAAAQAAYSKLAADVAQYPQDDFQNLWNSPAYKAAFESDLQKFAADVTQPSVTPQVVQPTAGALSVGGLSVSSTELVIGALLLFIVLR